MCSNCRYKLSLLTDHGRSRAQAHSKKYGWQIQLRAASTIPSVTAVNAKREIPTAFQELHASLKALEQHAGVYVDTSQLKLALRGIESEDALTRVAGEIPQSSALYGPFAHAETSVGTQWSSRSAPARESSACGPFGSGATLGEAAVGQRREE